MTGGPYTTPARRFMRLTALLLSAVFGIILLIVGVTIGVLMNDWLIGGIVIAVSVALLVFAITKCEEWQQGAESHLRL